MPVLEANSKPKNNLPEDWEWLMKTWVHLKKEANKSGDYETYKWFLKELRTNFSKIYAGFTHENWIKLFDEIFKTIACELKEIVIKSKNKPMPKKTPIPEMTDEQLLDSYKKGTKWALDHAQVTSTDKNELGEIYNDQEWQIALNRIERIEKELQKRGLSYS